MDALALATRGYATQRLLLSIVDLLPDPTVVDVPLTESMWVVMSRPVDIDTDVSLSSDDTGIATVPATVTVLNNQQVAEFAVTAVSIGITQIVATYQGVEQRATIYVHAEVDDSPTPTGATDLVADGAYGTDLRPTPTSTEES
jgi:hypothetical protein